ncbi:MAG TPA: SRPBCC family protein [Noviherbaspirillum sp.]|uniref:CoxG family protein n=1 Tax=Noviherbaspirillum sp. TaxID=1926288 RepID=UPI002D5F7660|nr:SRPBCC family protein [Noviherbaspirillum sp.]HYD94682.1 SRPBCC family protein [Noviherbaspirillum sp.]
MLSAKRELSVTTDLDTVWSFVSDMGNWAGQMPGYISHEEVNANDSIWTVKIDLGPYKRPVVMDIHVVEWIPPHEVRFELKGKFDPFHGNGTFRADAAGTGSAIKLEFQAEATGSMAKVVTAMATPVLKKITDQFSANLVKALEERSTSDQPPQEQEPAQAKPPAWSREGIVEAAKRIF